MAFTIFHTTAKNGKLSNQGASYVVYDSTGATKTATAMTQISGVTGVYYASLDPTTWTRHGDGMYLVHVYQTNKSTVLTKSQLFWVAVVDDKIAPMAHEADLDSIIAKLPTNYIMGSSVADDKDDEVDAIKAVTDNLPDLGNLTTLINHLTDIKGTSFVKDTHSLTDLKDYVDEVEDLLKHATYGLEQIKNQTNKIDAAATTAPSAATTGSLLDRLANKDVSKTFDSSTDSLEAIRDNQSGGGGSGADSYEIRAYANSSGSPQTISVIVLKNGQKVAGTDLALTIYKRNSDASAPTTVGTISVSSPNTDDIFDAVLPGTYTAGEVYTVAGTVKVSGVTYNVATGFVAQ